MWLAMLMLGCVGFGLLLGLVTILVAAGAVRR